MATDRLLVTVRTFPTPSRRYIETVCTAGVTVEGDWLRLYPIRLRYLEDDKKYTTWQVITITYQDQSSDGRIESRRPDSNSIIIDRHISDHNERHQWIARSITNSLNELQSNGRTIGPVRVKKLIKLYYKPVDPDWRPDQIAIFEQKGLFEQIKPLEKVPFEFRVRWLDMDDVEHDSLILQWEFYEAWRQYKHRHGYDDPEERVVGKFLERCERTDHLAFFMGNYKQHPQNFGVCGMYYPPRGSIKSDEPLF